MRAVWEQSRHCQHSKSSYMAGYRQPACVATSPIMKQAFPSG